MAADFKRCRGGSLNAFVRQKDLAGQIRLQRRLAVVAGQDAILPNKQIGILAGELLPSAPSQRAIRSRIRKKYAYVMVSL